MLGGIKKNYINPQRCLACSEADASASRNVDKSQNLHDEMESLVSNLLSFYCFTMPRGINQIYVKS
jgi:hypothetical protein